MKKKQKTLIKPWMKKYKLFMDNLFISGVMKETKKDLSDAFILKPQGYTRMNLSLLKSIIEDIPESEEHVDIILYNSDLMKENLIRIGNVVLAPVVDENYISEQREIVVGGKYAKRKK